MRLSWIDLTLPPINLWNAPKMTNKNQMGTYEQIIHVTKYARYLEDKKRRETWEETVTRYVDFMSSKVDLKGSYKELHGALLRQDIVPSMRLLMTAGEACERDNIAAFNCAYTSISSKRVFSEILYILMNGTGIGFSNERKMIDNLPTIPKELSESGDVIVVADSKRGWAVAFRKLMSSLWEGDIPNIDYSKIRPAGARLKTFGGRASGAVPLQNLFTFVTETFKIAQGRKLNSLEVHDIVCMIGDIVVVGGVRRSALIGLSNLTDHRMRDAKTGQWYLPVQDGGNPHRMLANNSVCYTEQPDAKTFLEEWLSLVKSGSGERGIFNRIAAQNQAARWGRRSADLDYGCNPCSEIILRDKQFCNLTEVVVRQSDTYNELKKKIELATILGTYQSTLTDFKFLSEEWKKNTDEERLLGVSLTGIMDSPLLNGSKDMAGLPKILEELRDHARKVNIKWAERFNVSVSTAITCVKPSGTVSQLVNSSSGIHARFAPYYIRRIQLDKKDPVCQYLLDNGFPLVDYEAKKETTMVASFPMKAPEGSVMRTDMTAIEQMEIWLIYQDHFCEHKPSCTVYVKEHEWVEVGAWVWKHFNRISGISFLPHSDHVYQQAPYEDLTKEQYEAMLATMPEGIDWSEMIEDKDNTTATQELACTAAGGCEV
jgi:ribonucleoside-triphosphate reductase (thioredoxin)